MRGTAKGRSPVALIRRAAVLPLVLFALVTSLTGPAAASPAGASRAAEVIVLPGATSAEGIAPGRGDTFFAGDLFTGDIFRGNVERGTARPFIDAPEGRMAVGMSADTRHDLLFVAGGAGQAFVYSTRTRAAVASYEVADPAASFVNDVIVTRGGAWFTDSARPSLYFVPVDRHGRPGQVHELALSGPAAELSGDFNLNGIEATSDGKTLLVAHSANNQIYRVNPATGASAAIAGATPTGPDGIVFEDGRLWAVGNNQVARFLVNRSLTAAVAEKIITSDLFQTPSTAALFGRRLAVINAKFDTGFPPTADQYEAIIVKA
jgi:sugar lactone lactonase YvrE